MSSERNLAISACMQHSRGIPGDNACIAGVDVRILLREYPEKFYPEKVRESPEDPREKADEVREKNARIPELRHVSDVSSLVVMSR